MANQTANEKDLPRLLAECASDPCCNEVLKFLRQHPRTRFSQVAIVRTLNSNRLYVERALTYLTDSGLVKSYLEKSGPFYSLEVVLEDRQKKDKK